MTAVRLNRILQLISPAVIVTALGACGNAGDTDEAKCVLCGSYNDVRGAIANQDGSQAQVLAGYVVAAIERLNNIARVAEVDASGLFTLNHLRTTEAQTLALFTPDYILQGVLAMPSPVPNSVRQFFKLKTSELPKLINKGPIVTFQTSNGLDIQKDLASDKDGDGIPDGAATGGRTALTGDGLDLSRLLGSRRAGMSLAGGQSDSAQDIDADLLPNEKDPDIDGDGVINVLDSDDNANGLPDVLDPDANGDYQPDNATGQEDTDQYFSIGVEWISAQFTLRPKDDGTNETSLTLRTKVRDDVTPIAVQVRGAPTLLNNAYYIGYDTAGTELHTIFNGVLGDDGLSDDDTANDRTFGKKIIIDQARSPRAQETLFFELVFGTKDKPWTMEFPYVFPNLKPAAITAQYEVNTKTVQLKGNPFGDLQSFLWTVHVYASDGKAIWNSQTTAGDTRRFVLDEHIFAAGATYTFAISAQVQDKIPGNPSYVVYTKKYPLQ